MWRRPDRTTVEAARDLAEAAVADDVNLAVRRFLTAAVRAARASLNTPSLVAAGAPVEPITLGAFERFWAAALASGTVDARIRDAWLAGFRITSTIRVTATSLDAVPVYMAGVSDRLAHGLTPPIHEDAFDHVRVVVTQATPLGWSTPQTAQRIANELSWETDGPYWRTQLARTNTQIDAILDPLGAPGSPAREHARLHDPKVSALQADRAGIVKKLDAEASYWANRANLIATTETTGAYNSGALYALEQEGVECKEWLATNDSRTRPEHAAADGQIVKRGQSFTVGGYMAPHPGAASLPARLSVRCRCALVGADCPGPG